MLYQLNVLSGSLKNQVNHKKLHGIQVERKAPKITCHL